MSQLISMGLKKLKCNCPFLDFLKCLNTLVTLRQLFLKRVWRHLSFENFFYSKRWKLSREVWNVGKRVNVRLWISSCLWLRIESGDFWPGLIGSQILFLLFARVCVCVLWCIYSINLSSLLFLIPCWLSQWRKAIHHWPVSLVNYSIIFWINSFLFIP